jgi:hypothetical protein
MPSLPWMAYSFDGIFRLVSVIHPAELFHHRMHDVFFYNPYHAAITLYFPACVLRQFSVFVGNFTFQMTECLRHFLEQII